MKKISYIILILVLILGIAGLAKSSWAVTIQAASCSYPDVNSAVIAASEGDTVTVPAGSCIWSSQLAITKGITLKGAGMYTPGVGTPGVGNTYITGAVGPYTHMITYISAHPEHSVDLTAFNLSGFTFDANNDSMSLKLANFDVAHPVTKVRVHDNSFLNCIESAPNPNEVGFQISGTGIWGVFDNNIVTGEWVVHTDGESAGELEWNSNNTVNFIPGSGNNFYFEDNTYIVKSAWRNSAASPMTGSGWGGRYASRFNTFNYVNPNLITSWKNTGYSSWSSSGANFSATSTGGTNYATSNTITTKVGEYYRLVITGTITAGAAPIITGTGGFPTTTLSSGLQSIHWQATDSSTTITITSNASATFGIVSTTFIVSSSIDPWFDAHGNQSVKIFGTMGVEIYGNRLLTTNFPDANTITAFSIRGGISHIFYNHISKTDGDDHRIGALGFNLMEEFADNLNPTNYSCGSGLLEGSSCASDGETQHINKSYWWNNRGSNCYGNNRLITPTLVVDCSIGWSNFPASSDCLYNGAGKAPILPDKQYWSQVEEDFNGTSGVGCGTLATMQAIHTCTDGVGFWVPNAAIDPTAATCADPSTLTGANNHVVASVQGNIGTLYKCTALNTWTAYYTPYTYPHPLRNEVIVIYGDVSGDGQVSAYDAALVAQAAVGLITFTSDQINAGDVDGSGSIAAYDAALIAQKAVGLITKFPVEG